MHAVLVGLSSLSDIVDVTISFDALERYGSTVASTFGHPISYCTIRATNSLTAEGGQCIDWNQSPK